MQGGAAGGFGGEGGTIPSTASDKRDSHAASVALGHGVAARFMHAAHRVLGGGGRAASALQCPGTIIRGFGRVAGARQARTSLCKQHKEGDSSHPADAPVRRSR